MGRWDMDTQSLGESAQRPGIDPRSWVEHGTVDDVDFDPEYGLVATVTLLPQEVQISAIVPTLYGGDGWGMFVPVRTGSDVVVLFPGGDFSNTPVIVGTLWSPARKPQTDVTTNDHLYLKVEPSKDVHVHTTGGGKVHVKVEGAGDVVIEVDTGKIHLGASGLLVTDGVVHGTGIDPFTGVTYSVLGNTSGVVRAKK